MRLSLILSRADPNHISICQNYDGSTAETEAILRFDPGVAGLALAVGLPVSVAATTEMIVVDWHTGLAIGGYDPVAFFTDSKPMEGRADFEFRYGGAVWRFCNSGNRDAFADRPDVYMPRFGGYDPTGVARGVATPGNPNVWLIAGQRLFLFYDRGRLEKFATDSDRLLAEAERKWPAVTRTLSP